MDHTEGTYAAAELLHGLFDAVVIVTPRDSIATFAPLVTRQGILRRLNERRIRVETLSEPRWSERFESGSLETVNVYNGDIKTIDNVAFLAWSTPRAPEIALEPPLWAAAIEVHFAGDSKLRPRCAVGDRRRLCGCQYPLTQWRERDETRDSGNGAMACRWPGARSNVPG